MHWNQNSVPPVPWSYTCLEPKWTNHKWIEKLRWYTWSLLFLHLLTVCEPLLFQRLRFYPLLLQHLWFPWRDHLLGIKCFESEKWREYYPRHWAWFVLPKCFWERPCERIIEYHTFYSLELSSLGHYLRICTVSYRGITIILERNGHESWSIRETTLDLRISPFDSSLVIR